MPSSMSIGSIDLRNVEPVKSFILGVSALKGQALQLCLDSERIEAAQAYSGMFCALEVLLLELRIQSESSEDA